MRLDCVLRKSISIQQAAQLIQGTNFKPVRCILTARLRLISSPYEGMSEERKRRVVDMSDSTAQKRNACTCWLLVSSLHIL